MKMLLLSLFAGALIAAENAAPKLSDALLKERWKAIAIHHSNTVRLLQAQADLAKSQAAYDSAMAEIRKACGDKFVVDDSGAEVVCVVAEKKK